MIRLPGHLPQLSGRWFTAYRVLWCAVFVFALIGTTVGSFVVLQTDRDINDVTDRLGLKIGYRDGGRTVSSMLQGKPPFPSDSRLLAIDGKPYPRGSGHVENEALVRALSGPEGTVHRLIVREPSGQTRDAALTVRQANLEAIAKTLSMTTADRVALYQASFWITGGLYLIAALLLFVRRPRDPVVALLTTGMFVQWAPLAPLAFGAAAVADRLAPFGNFAFLLIGCGLLLFPSGRFAPGWTWAVVAAEVGYLILGFAGVRSVAMQLIFAAIAIAIVVANVTRYRGLASPLERQQLKWVVGGMALSAAGYIVANALASLAASPGLDFNTIIVAALGQLFFQTMATCTLVGGLLISLLRYRLYDAETALSRSALYGGLALAMIAVFAGTEKLVELLAEQYFGESVGAASGAIAAGVAAAIIPLFHRRLERWAERRFKGPLLALRDDLPSDLGDWRETAELSELARDALARVAAALRSHGGAIVTPGAPDPVLAAQGLAGADLTDWLAAHDPLASQLDREDPLLPLRVPLGVLPGRGPTFLLLGPRPDGTMPGKDEREAAAAVADPLSRALSVTAQRNTRDHTLSTTLTDLAARLTRLEARSA